MSIRTQLPDDMKEMICTVKINVQGKEREFHLHEDLTINYETAEFELDSVPQIYQLWGMIHSEVKEQVNILDKKMRRRKGKLVGDILATEGKGLRRNDIEDMVECDDELLKMEAEYIKMQKINGKLYYTMESLRMKNDNMRSLLSWKKQECR